MARKASAALPLPRYIKPENVRIGDELRVEWPEQKGIVKSHVGKVARREYVGQVRMYVTAEEAVLFTWEPSLPSPRITLLRRAAEPHTQLW